MRKNNSPSSLRSKLDKYTFTSWVTIKEAFQYRNKLVTSVFVSTFRILLLTIVYSYSFKYVGSSINGMNANSAIWSLAIYHILLFTQFRTVFRIVRDEYRKGTLESYLNKPINYLVYKCFEQLGKGIPNLLVNLLGTVPLLYLLIGPPPALTISAIFGATIVILGGTLFSALLYSLISLANIWIEDADPIFWIVDKGVLILGGAYIPIALFPPWLQTLSQNSPFGAPMFATKMFSPNFSTEWLYLFGVQIIWGLLCLLFINVAYRATYKRIAVNGG